MLFAKAEHAAKKCEIALLPAVEKASNLKPLCMPYQKIKRVSIIFLGIFSIVTYVLGRKFSIVSNSDAYNVLIMIYSFKKMLKIRLVIYAVQ